MLLCRRHRVLDCPMKLRRLSIGHDRQLGIIRLSVNVRLLRNSKIVIGLDRTIAFGCL